MINERVIYVNDIWKGSGLRILLKGIRTWEIRMWLMAQLIYLAARVGGCGIELETAFVTEEESDG
jgi:hypothetical protein